MSELVIYHHLGLGDHFICNGLVREYAKKYDSIRLFCKPQNQDSVEDMYDDLNLSLLCGDDHFALDFIKTNPQKDYLFVGFNKLNDQEPFDYQFYKIANLEFATRWESFRCPELPKEEELKQALKLPIRFAIVHEDRERGYLIDRTKVNLPTIEMKKLKGFSLPNWRRVIEAADEIHVIDSSVMFFADSLNENNSKLFVHRYARNNPQWQLPTLKRNWVIL